MVSSHSHGPGTQSYSLNSTMKRSNDYGNQSHDNIKKPRFGQSYNSGYSLTGGTAGYHPVGGHFASMGGYHQAASQYATAMNQYNTTSVSSMVPQFTGAFSTSQFPSSYQQTAVNSSATNATGRTVYLGNVPADTQMDEIINHIKIGPIESIRVFPDKNCTFISFMDGAAAMAFYQEATNRKIMIHNQELKVGWGKPSPIPVNVQVAVSTQNASRNVYLGNLDDTFTESILREDLGKFGTIDTVKIVKDKNIGFVHFLSIASAMKAVQSLPTDPKYANKKVNYGKDRCVQKNMQNGNTATQYSSFPGASMNFQGFAGATAIGYGGSAFDPYHTGMATGSSQMENGTEMRSPTSPLFSSASSATGSANSSSNVGNRTIYLGNIHPDTTCEEICNVIRGGILQQIRYMPEKHIAFITFIDPNSASSFMYLAQQVGVVIKNRRLKIGWGKNLGPLPGHIQIAVTTQSASRNVYVGQIDENMTEEKLRRDFQEYGEIELVNILKEKNCGFINFTSIASAIKAIEGIKSKDEYKKYRINYGKDRCGNPPRGITMNNMGISSGKTKGRNNGESDARVLHAGDNSESGNIDGVEDDVLEGEEE
ncbi:16666_t:CDS:2 [Entrophospora sp. SA101]|nr:16666_t:CDS:2 [Entrophospora sp. SA101]CAJ0905893.1 2994_t:CDS:2 [Entrophospora sp. SA101]CAJ0909161.1 9973_t:CDS:2 [Entrophospora sp. SA101]